MLNDESMINAPGVCGCVSVHLLAMRCRIRWATVGGREFGVDLLDGVGSTELLHILLSNSPGENNADSALTR